MKKKVTATNPNNCKDTVTMKKTTRKISIFLVDNNVQDMFLTINPEVAHFSEFSCIIEKKHLELITQGTYDGTESSVSSDDEKHSTCSGDCNRNNRHISNNTIIINYLSTRS